MHSLFFGSFFFVTLHYFMLHRYGDFFGRPNNIEWWNDGMTEWRNIAPNPKRRNIKKYKKCVKNKRLCNRLNGEPTSQRGMRRCMHRRASSRCQGRGEPLWFPEGNCHRGNGPLPVVRSKEYPRRFDQWRWALRYVFSEVCFFRQLFLCALGEFARSDKNGKYNYATTKRASKMQGGRVPAQLRE